MKPGQIQAPPNDATLFGLYNRFYYGVPAPRFNPNPNIAFANTRQPSAGAQRYAYDTLGLVEFTFIGPGIANRMQFRSVQPPQQRVLNAVTTVGLGGLVAGTLATQPLQANVWGDNNPVL